jgi:menaquinone-dependent protoporphyrinogen oxidase
MSRALVVYGSKRGGTAGLAQMIGSELQQHGWEVVVHDAAQPADLRGVDRTMPVWLFGSGPLDDSARSGDIAAVPQVQEIARRLEARGHMTFGGRLAADAKGLGTRSLARKYAGDYRDPAQVGDWVREILHELTPAEPTLVQAAIPAQRQAPSELPTIA